MNSHTVRSIAALLVAVCPAVISPVLATDWLRVPDVRSMRLGGGGVMLSSAVNPALVAEEEQPKVFLSLIDRYSVSGLATLSAALTLPNSHLPTAIHLATFGYDAYREWMLRTAVARRLNERISLGVALQYVTLQTELFDERSTSLSADVGLFFTPNERFALGLTLMNTPRITFGERIATGSSSGWAVQAGGTWNITDDVRLLTGIGKGRRTPWEGNAGIEYSVAEGFHIGAGIAALPLLPAIGAGFEGRRFAIDVAATTHPVLGMSWGVAITVHL
ncbi:MAG: hypothetical protein LBB27_04200 [Tannerellaceae bacterium]|jgi:hypothetical protein|nr:hypothetical protein [Tannerellaceae bacterium]